MVRPRILIIEDEPSIRRLMQLALESSFDVCVAQEGGEGLHQAQLLKPDLILLDLSMPGMDGLTVLGKLKGNRQTSGIPVVIVSGRGETDTLLEGQRAGAVDHLIKPFDIAELRRVIQRQLLL